MSSRITAFYLARACEGLAPMREFVSSYRRYYAGVDHELIVLFKGFKSARKRQQTQALFTGLSFVPLEIAEGGFDIGSYAYAATKVRTDFLFFLNTFSTVLADNWLEKIYCQAQKNEIGLVGATASYQSLYSPLRARWNRARQKSFLARLIKKPLLLTQWNRATALRRFPPFPNPHVRTNGFMVKRSLFLALSKPRFKDKMDALLFESGPHSLTRQVLLTKKQVCIVDKEGACFTAGEWKESCPFWNKAQKNLLIADNQTRRFDRLPLEKRLALQIKAWGESNQEHPQ